ncbi:MAG: Crp/Fnr family transcriptional regulator [Endomicrobia bacterium]|nr:Crp/Fnr family transcriptional regulator [Endomicrobiia bacterium]MCL2506224.1 Crp/Fnr family transcriptional regulator [Endomicrobiia bacterium]
MRIGNNYKKTIAKNLLFQNMSESEIGQLMPYLYIKKHEYAKDSFIECDNEKFSYTAFLPKKLYILIEGQIHLIIEDACGTRLMAQQYEAGDILAGTLFDVPAKIFAGYQVIKKAIVASLSFDLIINTQRLPNETHIKMLKNLCLFFADDRIKLYKRLECLSRTCIRERIKFYLLDQKHKTGKNKFELPITKNDMANYLSVNRSAMTRELAAMKKEKLINFKGRKFTLFFE